VSEDERAALGAAQQRLLAALVGGAEAPPGFDPERIRVQARALRAKHAHAAPAPRRPRGFLPWWRPAGEPPPRREG
jgi:hypothetical protein